MKSKLKKYQGVVVPMVSPVRDDFGVDYNAIERIIDSFIQHKVTPFVLGTTGEVTSLSPSQKVEIVSEASRLTQGKTTLLAGIANNSVFAAIEEGKRYADLGVDALVALVPNYYPIEVIHAQKWLEKLADHLPVPMFLYNIPVTTHHSLSLDLIEEFSHHPNVIGVKDSEQNEQRLKESLSRWASREDFLFLVGCAAFSTLGLKGGADGVVPSVANLFPDLYYKLYESATKGEFEITEKYQQLTNLISSFIQDGRNVTSAIPALKAAMSIKGLCSPNVLQPMIRMDCEIEEEYLRDMKVKFEKLDLIVE